MNNLKADLQESSQKAVFVQSEGDEWFNRNQAALAKGSVLRNSFVERIAQHLPHVGTRGWHVLKIGCGQGGNLDGFSRARNITGHGMDPSRRAISSCTAAFPHLKLRVGTADALPYPDDSLDEVWFGFCLYLIDRNLPQRAAAEADRVLSDGGLLVVIDFDPISPYKRAHHHRAGLYSYKMDCIQFFSANPAYSSAEKNSINPAMGEWAKGLQERVALNICRKSLDLAYQPA